MSPTGAVWLLNPDAELELAHLAQGRPGPYSAPESLLAQMEKRAQFFVPLTQEDRSYFIHTLGDSATGSPFAHLWCPTPRGVAVAKAHGFIHAPPPPTDVLLRANNKLELAHWSLPCLPGRVVTRSTEEVEALTASSPRRLKRAFGFAGRGQRTVRHQWSKDDRRWVTDSLRAGPLVVEAESDGPLFSIHGLAHSEPLVGQAVRQAADRYGSVTSTHEADNPVQELEVEAHQLALRLAHAGYQGPFGVDFIRVDGEFYAIDLNARFTLGWSLGMGEKRSTALDRLQSWTPEHAPSF